MNVRRLIRLVTVEVEAILAGPQHRRHGRILTKSAGEELLLLSPRYRATTFSISALNSAYCSAPGWYIATFPARSNSTSVGVVDAP
jgi:hypothetical protein